jgi:putative tryptophan/tyrosine transport system substrate-binding protein
MKRREFIMLLGGAAAAWPLAARAQQPPRKRKVGILIPFAETDQVWQTRVRAMRQELARLGWAAGGNVQFDERWTTDNMDRVRDGVAQLLAFNPDVIVAWSRRAVEALQQQTRTVPVVFVGIGDPVEGGVVASFAKPGGNFTGFTLWEYSIIGKMLEILKKIRPGTSRAALVYNPDNPATVIMARWFEAVAAPLAVRPTLAPVHTPAEIERAIEAFAREPDGALLFPPDVTVTTHREFITALVARHRLPAIYFDRVVVLSGGLMSYSPDRVEQSRQAASYADRILRGEKPGDLPVQQPTKYELVINLKAAKAIDIAVPQNLLVAADEVIE